MTPWIDVDWVDVPGAPSGGAPWAATRRTPAPGVRERPEQVVGACARGLLLLPPGAGGTTWRGSAPRPLVPSCADALDALERFKARPSTSPSSSTEHGATLGVVIADRTSSSDRRRRSGRRSRPSPSRCSDADGSWLLDGLDRVEEARRPRHGAPGARRRAHGAGSCSTSSTGCRRTGDAFDSRAGASKWSHGRPLASTRCSRAAREGRAVAPAAGLSGEERRRARSVRPSAHASARGRKPARGDGRSSSGSAGSSAGTGGRRRPSPRREDESAAPRRVESADPRGAGRGASEPRGEEAEAAQRRSRRPSP